MRHGTGEDMGWTTRIGAALALVALAGCGVGQTRLDPLNWFGTARETPIVATAARPGEPVVDQVVSLRADPAPGGAIVSAVGLPPTQGFWNADLVRLPSQDPSVALLEFRLLPPPVRAPVGTQPSREVLAGAFLSREDLAGIRTIAVQGARNSRSVSRR
jgi:hypothetical protein